MMQMQLSLDPIDGSKLSPAFTVNFCSLLSENSMKNINKKKYYKSITFFARQISLNLSLRMVLPIKIVLLSVVNGEFCK